MTIFTPDLCVIGAGSGGLSVAAAAASFGVDVVLIERHRMGGDCLNVGCVPSKALLAAGKRAQAFRTAAPFGVAALEPAIDWAAVHAHVDGVIAAIAPTDSVERFTGLGVTVLEAQARFLDDRTVEAGGRTIKARRFVIATGSRPFVPPIPGLDGLAAHTNETIFDLAERPEHLLVIGGGPIGLEMAQAHRRLGCRVTVIEAAKPMPKDDPEAVAVVLAALAAEGITLIDEAKVLRAEARPGGLALVVERNGRDERIDGSHLLVAAGRRPVVDGLDLDKAGVATTPRGVTVDAGLRTTNRRVYAIGDVAGSLQFTHMANYHAGLVIRSALFRLPVKAATDRIPWVTYTDPELAQVGLSESEAQRRGLAVTVHRWPFHDNDRALAERDTKGFVKLVTGKRGLILGATVVGGRAGDVIALIAVAINRRLTLAGLASIVLPYPTIAEAAKRAAVSSFADTVKQPFVRGLISFLRRFG